ncbi:ribonuclease H2, subunit B [Obelidium mucronatum]|nr:ribonuclease H2, subunit B [Obelidium mucronatum]
MLGPQTTTTTATEHGIRVKAGASLAIVATAEATREESFTTLVPLPHPRTGEAVYFALSPQSLLQVTRHATEKRSCFVGDNVLQDGSFLVMTPFDPLFLLLPLLDNPSSSMGEDEDALPPSKKAKANDPKESLPKRRFEQLENILHSEKFPQLSEVADIEGLEQKLSKICDIDSTIPGMTFFRLNDEKTKVWLLEKSSKLLEKYDSYDLLKVNGQWESGLSEDEKKEHQKSMIFKLICEVVAPGKWQDCLKEVMGLNTVAGQTALNGPTGGGKAVYSDPRIAPPAPIAGNKKGDTKKAPNKPSKPSTKKAVSTKGMAPLTSFFTKK